MSGVIVADRRVGNAFAKYCYSVWNRRRLFYMAVHISISKGSEPAKRGLLMRSIVRRSLMMSFVFSAGMLLSGCAWLGFGPEIQDSHSDLLKLPVVHERFQETSLQSISSGDAAFRITWLPPFDSPMLVRYDRGADGKVKEQIKQLSGAGGYTPGYLMPTHQREVSAARFDSLLQKLKESGFWEGPAQDPYRPKAVDGPFITVEACVGGRYHLIERYAPGNQKEEAKLVDFLFDAISDYDERNVIRLPWIK